MSARVARGWSAAGCSVASKAPASSTEGSASFTEGREEVVTRTSRIWPHGPISRAAGLSRAVRYPGSRVRESPFVVRQADAFGLGSHRGIARHEVVRGATSKLSVRVCDRDGSTPTGGPPVFTQISRSQAEHVTRTALVSTPTRPSARTDSRTVAPVVSTSSTTTTSAFPAPPCRASGLCRTDTRPRRLCWRSSGVKPTESRTPHHTRNIGTIRQSGSHPAAARAVRSTGSPPRRRAEPPRLGAGTNTRGRPGVRKRASPRAIASPSGSLRSRLPRSLTASTARRAGPVYGASAQQGTPGSVRGRTRLGPSVSAAAQPGHHPTPAASQPAHAAGSTKSSRAAMCSAAPMAEVCTRPPTFVGRISRAAPARCRIRGRESRSNSAVRWSVCWSARALHGNRPRTAWSGRPTPRGRGP